METFTCSFHSWAALVDGDFKIKKRTVVCLNLPEAVFIESDP